ncbi:MAG: tryptophan synthase subunit alpha [Pirellulaceae bacterium]|nr:tryptophan synthase subunit alpha [Pirellulaceae bacterium]
MSAIDDLFVQLRRDGKKAFLPFITAGDPDLAFTAKLLTRLDQLGCNMAEVGIPYSDPIADGPVIQASYTRALNKKIKLHDIFRKIGTVSPKLKMPLVTMVSYAVIHRVGLSTFVDQAKAAGFAGAIVPDLLVEECSELSTICREKDFSLIQLVTPTTPPERALKIAERSTGFLYFVSVTGITGERTELPEGLVERVDWLRQRTPLPICIGFGVSRPDHVRLLAPVADGLIVGSAIVRHMAASSNGQFESESALSNIEQLVKELMSALYVS